MLKNIWKYNLNNGECRGIVIADTQEDAKLKLKEMYKNWDGEYENEDDVFKIWNVVEDDNYNKDYPDILEIY